jgi:hypothetical protein
VLAVMNPDAAQQLTVELARGVSPEPAMPPTDLQRVNVPAPKAKQTPQPKQATQPKQ